MIEYELKTGMRLQSFLCFPDHALAQIGWKYRTLSGQPFSNACPQVGWTAADIQCVIVGFLAGKYCQSHSNQGMGLVLKRLCRLIRASRRSEVRYRLFF